MHEQACCRDEAANHQLPIAVAFSVIPVVSTEECSSLMQNLMQIHCCNHSVTLNATPTQYTCSLNGVYHSHGLVQRSCHCSHMCIPVHSPWLPGYVVFVVLMMAGLFSIRPVSCNQCSLPQTAFPKSLPVSLFQYSLEGRNGTSHSQNPFSKALTYCYLLFS